MATDAPCPTTPKVAVIGLGVAGLAAVKNLVEEGFQVVAFERNEYIGGLWKYTDDKTKLSVLTTTKSNFSHQSNAYTDFPYPSGTPDYPSGDQVASYLESYADHFHLRPYFRLSHQVRHVRRSTYADAWEVEAVPLSQPGGEAEADGRIELFDKVYIASGALGIPNLPQIRGTKSFKGECIHAREYKGPEPYKGKRVLVVGMGNTGGDTATSLVGTAEEVYISHRRGARIFTRYKNGRPSDHAATRRMAHLGGFLNRSFPSIMPYLTDRLMAQMVKACYGPRSASPIIIDPAWKLLPGPPFACSPATSSDTLMRYFSTGQIRPITSILEVTETGVRTEEGEYEVDVIIFASGGKYDLSFLEGSANPYLPPPSKSYPRLYQTVFSTTHPDSLAIYGVYSEFSFAAMVNADLASMAIAQVWKGSFPLPSRSEMELWCDNNERAHRRITRGLETKRPGTDPARLEGWFARAAGTGIDEHLGWGWRGWNWWWRNKKLYRLIMDGVNTPHVYRLFKGREGGRKSWDGAEAAIWRLNGLERE